MDQALNDINDDKAPHKSLRVLHLEDNRQDAELVEAILASDGLACEILGVATHEAFEAALRSGAFDVILADYNLPSFDGLSAQRLTSQLRPDLPFIFVSGSIGEDCAIDRLKDGATDYVLKDRIGRLPSAVRRALVEFRERAKRRQADAEARRLNAELEQRVIDRTRALEAANAALAAREQALRVAQTEAERANRAKSEFLSRMSHDLRTPLNAMLGFAQLLATDELDAERLEHVRQILQGGKHLLELINEVLDIARIEAGHLSLSLEPVQAGAIVEQAVQLVRPLAAAGAITLRIGPVPHDCVLQADRQRLNQILLNLLSNAVKYNRRGGTITIGLVRRDNRRVRIMVSDTGAGIPTEKLKRLFQPFERLGAEATPVEGTGLGLAVSRGLAEVMGGSIGVVSEVDVGSTFWIELPLSEGSTMPLSDVPPSPHRVTTEDRVGTVLYIEDNLSNVRLMQRILKRRPRVTMLHAGGGQLGIDVAREHRPDAIFLDLHLPDMDGGEVLRQLSADPRLSPIPVVILSGDATPGQTSRSKAAGATAYLTKPFNIGEVLELVDDLLRQSASRSV